MLTSLPDKSESAKPKFLAQVRTILRTRHYSLRTEEAYLGWIRRFILFHDKRHPQEMGGTEVAAFLNYLAGERGVAAATPEPSPQCAPLPLRCGAGTQIGRGGGPAAGPACAETPDGAGQSGGAGGIARVERPISADGRAALRERVAPARVLASAGQGCGSPLVAGHP